MYQDSAIDVPEADRTTPASALRQLAQAAAARSYVPYSKTPSGVALLLSDGGWVLGSRTENASYSLTIPAVTAAIASAVTAGRRDVVALVLSKPASLADRAFLADAPTGALPAIAPDLYGGNVSLPFPRQQVSLARGAPDPLAPDTGIAIARQVAMRSLSPFSSFPVGCVIRTDSGILIPGVNVEHSDWTRAICAERSAIASAITLGASPATDIYVSCLKDRLCTPCGACVQVLVEFSPDMTVWLDRTPDSPERHQASALLPAAFAGRTLCR